MLDAADHASASAYHETNDRSDRQHRRARPRSRGGAGAHRLGIAGPRALARGAADRTLLTDAPSLTAHEIGAQLAPVFPEHEPAIRRTMDLFDAVRYGRYAATEADAGIVRDTEATLRKAKPVLAAVGAELDEAWGVPR